MEATPFHGEGQASAEQSEDLNIMLDLQVMKPELDHQPLYLSESSVFITSILFLY